MKQETAEGCTCNDSPDLCDYCEDAQILKEAREQAMGQKSLEEAAEKCFKYIDHRNTFISGAKWQAERMYSEEETIQLLIKFNQEIGEVEDIRGWFEQFKKK